MMSPEPEESCVQRRRDVRHRKLASRGKSSSVMLAVTGRGAHRGSDARKADAAAGSTRASIGHATLIIRSPPPPVCAVDRAVHFAEV